MGKQIGYYIEVQWLVIGVPVKFGKIRMKNMAIQNKNQRQVLVTSHLELVLLLLSSVVIKSESFAGTLFMV